MTKIVNPSNENSILLKDKKLIVLKAAHEYCESNEVERIRYSKLRFQSNAILSQVTNGESTDFGGNFESIIKELEGKFGNQSYLTREKSSTRATSIVPNIQKIRRLLEKRGLYIEQSSDISEYLPQIEFGESPRGYPGLVRITHPSDRIQVFHDWIHLAQQISVYKSHNWDISLLRKDKTFDLSDKQISKILELANNISLNNALTPFKLVIEYRPESIPSSYYGDLETFTETGN